MGVQSQGGEDPLESEMATHSSILAWEIPWQRSLAGYNLVTKQQPLGTGTCVGEAYCMESQ